MANQACSNNLLSLTPNAVPNLILTLTYGDTANTP